MQKQAPSVGRILTMVLFALSCFGLLLFLWLSFGGPVPLKPEGYRFKVRMPEATQLGIEAEVRVAGVSIGKVRKKSLDENGDFTVAEVEVDEKYAPIATDAKAILRQKTLLGETYIEMTPGTANGPKLKEGAFLGQAQVAPTVELDEIFQALDPQTRKAFQSWQRELAGAIKDGRGRDLGDAFGNLPEFAADGADVLGVLDEHERAVSRLVKNTGVVFGALTENEGALRNLITTASQVFRATASRNEALADSIEIFPTFLDESKTTLARLETFSRDTRPLIRDLKPAARDLRPTLAATRKLAPDLRSFFRDLDPLIEVSKKGLPALENILDDGVRPALSALAPFLQELNPIFQYLEMYQGELINFLAGSTAVANTVDTGSGQGHYLRQFGPTGMEAVAMYRERLANHRGNTYPAPGIFVDPRAFEYRFPFPSFDCDNAGGERKVAENGSGPASCYLQKPINFQGKSITGFPQVGPADYSRGR